MGGFILSFLINLIFHLEFFVLALIAFLLHIFFDFPIAITYVLLAVWILVAFFITLGLGVLSRNTPPPAHQKNINPYSKSTKSFSEAEEKNTENSEK